MRLQKVIPGLVQIRELIGVRHLLQFYSKKDNSNNDNLNNDYNYNINNNLAFFSGKKFKNINFLKKNKVLARMYALSGDFPN